MKKTKETSINKTLLNIISPMGLKIKLGGLQICDFTIEVGVMDYGFEINGILGMDFMKSTGIIINEQ